MTRPAGHHTTQITALLTAVALLTALAAWPPTAAADQTDQPIVLDGSEGWVQIADSLRVRYTPDSTGDSGDDIELMDASSCNQNVCINLTSASCCPTYIQKWTTTASVTTSTCSHARFRRNGTTLMTSSTICSTGSGTLQAVWDNPGWFFDGDQLCNTWNNISGHPCATIKA